MTRCAARPVMTLALVASLVFAACGSDAAVESIRSESTPTDSDVPSTVDDPVTSGGGDSTSVPPDTVAGAEVPTEIGAAVIEEERVALLAMPPEDREAYLGELSMKFERELAAISGLEAELGGPEATDVALRNAWGPIVAEARAIDTSKPIGFRRAPDSPSIAEGLFGGLMLVLIGAEGLVEASNDMKPEQPFGSRTAGSATLEGSIDEALLTFEPEPITDKGVTTKLRTQTIVLPCPDAEGRVSAFATIDVSATAGSKGQNGTLEVTFDGQVDDNAALASSEIGWRMQWADFGGGKGEFIDLSGNFGGTGGVTVNRTGGTVTADLVNSAAILGALFGYMIGDKLGTAAKKGWESGRCVRIDVAVSPGPKDLQPSSESTITAQPRSKIDGSAVGGTVSARISAGGATVEPNVSPADATLTYVAPDQPNQSGTVALESRSKRGVGKAEIVFETGSAAFLIVGGLDDWQVSQVVCDVMVPFQLSSSIGTMELSGGLSGTYVFNGIFEAHYEGTYQITLPPGPGLSGSMIGFGSGTVLGNPGSGTENYVLTPAEPC